jgi:hypothetical protein
LSKRALTIAQRSDLACFQLLDASSGNLVTELELLLKAGKRGADKIHCFHTLQLEHDWRQRWKSMRSLPQPFPWSPIGKDHFWLHAPGAHVPDGMLWLRNPENVAWRVWTGAEKSKGTSERQGCHSLGVLGLIQLAKLFFSSSLVQLAVGCQWSQLFAKPLSFADSGHVEIQTCFSKERCQRNSNILFKEHPMQSVPFVKQWQHCKTPPCQPKPFHSNLNQFAAFEGKTFDTRALLLF